MQNKMMPLLAGRNDEGNQTCVECIEGTGKCVMEGVIRMAKEYCERTECPCIKRRVCVDVFGIYL
jgi:hypothetical protein